jgi:predicted alpha/beta hydrolase family esterase
VRSGTLILVAHALGSRAEIKLVLRKKRVGVGGMVWGKSKPAAFRSKAAALAPEPTS